MENIKIFTEGITRSDLESLAQVRFGDMVKGVIDIRSGVVALGGELHADEESLLIQNGSSQEDLWGINIYLEGQFPETIEFDSMINIRPSQGNRSRGVEDIQVQKKILAYLEKKIV